MASIQHLILFCGAIFLLCLVQEGATIRCYECNSHTDARCKEKNPPEELIKDCSTLSPSTKYTFCRKITQVIEFSVNNLPPDTRTIRSCGSEVGNYENRCYQRSGFGGRQEVCACSQQDLCNSAIKVNKAAYGFILTIFVILVARF